MIGGITCRVGGTAAADLYGVPGIIGPYKLRHDTTTKPSLKNYKTNEE